MQIVLASGALAQYVLGRLYVAFCKTVGLRVCWTALTMSDAVFEAKLSESMIVELRTAVGDEFAGASVCGNEVLQVLNGFSAADGLELDYIQPLGVFVRDDQVMFSPIMEEVSSAYFKRVLGRLV